MAAGSEEPNALIRLGKGAYAEPNLRATQIEIFEGLYAESQNRTPSLKFDIGAINSVLDRFFPAGFYYKTFHVASINVDALRTCHSARRRSWQGC